MKDPVVVIICHSRHSRRGLPQGVDRPHRPYQPPLSTSTLQGRWPWNRLLDNSHQTRWPSLDERRLKL